MPTRSDRPGAAPETPGLIASLPPNRPSPWLLLRVWLGLGVQSFGGGAATLYLIRRTVVEQRGWLSDAEFTRDWAICQISPGINLLGLTILIGWRMGGLLGIGLSLLGLLLPSVSITIVLTALYAELQGLAAVQAALRGVVPATVGLGLLLAIQMGRPLIATSKREGWASLALSGGLLLGSGLAIALELLLVIAILLLAGCISAGAYWRGVGRPLRVKAQPSVAEEQQS